MADAGQGVGAGPVPQHSLRDYAVLADGMRAALVGAHGAVAWLCAPRFDDDAVMSALLGGPGMFAVRPMGGAVWGGSYRGKGLVWTHRWMCDDGGVLECDDALQHPAAPDTAVLLRRIRAVEGDAQVRVGVDVAANFGSRPLTDLHRDDHGVWTGRSGDVEVRLTGLPEATVHRAGSHPRLVQGALSDVLRLSAGDTYDLVLEVGTPRGPVPDPARAWPATRDSWRRAIPELPGLLVDRDVDHARAVLRGLTAPSGGMVAAASTSLPERRRHGRYDYRYCWIRDQALVGLAAARAGDLQLLDDAVRFVGERVREHGAQLAPAYTITGERVPDQRSIDLPGYGGGGVRVGNHVNAQFQLDVFGEAMQLFAAASRLDRLDGDGWRAATTAAQAAAQRWQEPGAGIWELEPKQWTHSRLSVVAGLRALAGARPIGGTSSEWLALADTITAEASRDCVHPQGWWQRAPDDPRVDAALLLPVLRGALPADDPRTAATVDRVLTELQQEGYIYRFRHDERDLQDSEGAFLFCNFVASLCAHRLGRPLTALRLFERARSACGPPGLLTEEFDVQQRQLRGNLPQAFVHGLLLECAATLPEHGEATVGGGPGSEGALDGGIAGS